MRRSLTRVVQAVGAALAVATLLLGLAGTASAAPAITIVAPTSTAVTAGVPVTYTAEIVCDVNPCQVSWRWYNTGTSNPGNGNTMGFGTSISYTFPAGTTGVKAVVAKVNNGARLSNWRTAQLNVVVSAP